MAIPSKIVLLCIALYQRTLSPDHGPLKNLFPYGFCPQHPTCSTFAAVTIAKRGIIIGAVLTFGRMLACHPWRKPSDEKLRALASSQHP